MSLSAVSQVVSGFLRLFPHVVLWEAWGQRRHLLRVAELLVRVHKADLRLSAEHRVIALLSVNQL